MTPEEKREKRLGQKREAQKRYRENHKDKVREMNRKWHAKNPGYKAPGYKKDLEKQKIDKKRKYWEDPEKYRKLKRSYRENKPEIYKKIKKKYYEKNKVKLIKKSVEYKRMRMKTDIGFRIEDRLRTRMWLALKGIRGKESISSYVGCNAEELKEYLKSLFTDGMTLDNYGKYGWHVDHIKPCALFDFTKEEEINECFHYTNLQPLWSKDNLSKGAKYG